MNSKIIRRIIFGVLALLALGYAGQTFSHGGLTSDALIPTALGIWWGFVAATGSGCG